MFSFDQLAIAIVVAPMAGGPSTPALVKAATDAGGFGLLAGGYIGPEAIRTEIGEVRGGRPDRPVGVNLMVPGDPAQFTPERARAVEEYRSALQPWADRYRVDLPQADTSDQPEWHAKLDVLLDERVDVATFIFGCPTAAEIHRLTEAGIAVGVTVTNVADAVEAEARGATFLVVQGPLAGGHQGSWAVDAPINTVPLLELLRLVRATTTLPLVAAGGISTGGDIRLMLDNGATAVQLGTAFLRSSESGASPLYRQSLASGAYSETIQTRAFSGRVARALANEFAREMSPHAPAALPEVNSLTRTIRDASAAAGDPEAVSMYAGAGFAMAEERPAGEILRWLWEQASR